MFRHPMNILWVLLLGFQSICSLNMTTKSLKTGVPIVYVFTVSQRACEKGLPAYIKFSLEQAVLTQYESDVILVSNYKECGKVSQSSDLIEGLIQIDTADLHSKRLDKFANLSTNIFQDDGYGNLWVTSALRFFF